MKRLLIALAATMLPIGAIASTPSEYKGYTPESLQATLNSAEWQDPASSYRFSYLHECNTLTRRVTPNVSNPIGFYCLGGYVEVTNPQGTRVCEVNSAGDWLDGGPGFSAKNCRWK